MSSSKETPRQKMIGMMYLVLTALLALNVTKDILDAFVIVNKGLENSNANYSDRNEKLYADFEMAKTIDPVKVTPSWKKAQEIQKQSAALTSYIDELQKNGELKMRVYAMLTDNKENKDHYLKNGRYKTDRLNIRSFKFYADGALGSRGACLLQPYSDKSEGQGFLLSKPEHFDSAAILMFENRFQMNTHCIGDSAARPTRLAGLRRRPRVGSCALRAASPAGPGPGPALRDSHREACSSPARP